MFLYFLQAELGGVASTLSSVAPVVGAASAALGIIGGIGGLFGSIKKNREAKKIKKQAEDLRKRTVRPVYNIQDEVKEVADLAESELQNNSIADRAMNDARLSLSQGIDAILKSGGRADFSTINSNYGNILKSVVQQLNVDRSRKIAGYNEAAYNLAKAKDTEFQYNKAAPFADRMQLAAKLDEQAAALRKDAQQQTANSLGTIIGSGSAFATAFNSPDPGRSDPNNTNGIIGRTASRVNANERVASELPGFIPPDYSTQPEETPQPYEQNLIEIFEQGLMPKQF